jgi:hypothetical protein
MEVIEETIVLSKYQKQKASIYKWREANKESFLLKQHQYFKNRMEDPVKKAQNLERVKQNNKAKVIEEQQRTGIIKKRGRPSKYSD